MRGYHKPIMIAGGVGNIRADHTHKHPLADGTLLVQLGGPGMLIGMGGGAASSMATGANTADLDFDSVQRGNAEIERRAQEVIDRCWQLGAAQSDPVDPRRRRGRPVERVARARARRRRRRHVRPARDPVRRAGHVAARDLVQRGAGALRARASRRRASRQFRAICERERCPFAVVGTRERRRPPRRRAIRSFDNRPVDVPLDVILGKPPKMTRDVRARPAQRCRRSHLADVDLRGRRVSRAAVARRRRQDVPRHDRRSHRRRAVRARSDGRSVAGAGRRRRGHADGFRRATPARRWRSASARRSR